MLTRIVDTFTTIYYTLNLSISRPAGVFYAYKGECNSIRGVTV